MDSRNIRVSPGRIRRRKTLRRWGAIVGIRGLLFAAGVAVLLIALITSHALRMLIHWTVPTGWLCFWTALVAAGAQHVATRAADGILGGAAADTDTGARRLGALLLRWPVPIAVVLNLGGLWCLVEERSLWALLTVLCVLGASATWVGRSALRGARNLHFTAPRPRRVIRISGRRPTSPGTWLSASPSTASPNGRAGRRWRRASTGRGSVGVAPAKVVKCLVCMEELGDGVPRTSCQNPSAGDRHAVHQHCVALAKNKCPRCKHKL